MRVIFVCIAVVMLSPEIAPQAAPWQWGNFVAQAFRDAKILQDANINAPWALLKAKFEDSIIYLGNEIYPGHTIDPPTLQFDLYPNCFYTFLIVYPPANNTDGRCLLLSMHVNVMDLDFESGWAVAKYLPANPIPGRHLYRYVLLLYKQTEKIYTDRYLLDLLLHRQDFSVPAFTQKYKLYGPVAGNFYVTQFPDNLKNICHY